MGCFNSKRKKEEVHIDLPNTETTFRAILLIQRWYRRHVELMEERRKFTWQIFQKLEYANEQDQLRLYNFFNALLQYLPTEPSREESKESSRFSLAEKKQLIDYEDLNIEDVEFDYAGVYIHSPMRRTDLDELINSYRKRKAPRLHAKYISEILRASIIKLKTMPNFNEASTSISKIITVVGDLHGKLDDLFMIFHKNGLPSSGNPYIFNGDFVDRGKKSMEVLILILSCFLVFPGSVFLNRGNHEDHLINIRYGFTAEVRRKYKEHCNLLLKLIEGVFRWLPIGTIVNGKVLVVHGGIANTTDLDLLRHINRSKYVSLLTPPIDATVAASSDELVDKEEWRQMFNLLWSDPMEEDGCTENTTRGAGMYFGPDVTRNFLAKYDFWFIVRSHECKTEGYEMQHDNKLITIFSASNYYELGSNHGAYLKLIGTKLQTQFVEYTSGMSKIRKLNTREQVGLVESSALKELSKQILARRDDLEEEFRKYDPYDLGFITVANWCKAMKQITQLNIDWFMLHDKVAKLDPSNRKIYYMTTFDGISPDVMKSQEQCKGLVETLYENRSNLETIFRIIDKDNSGYISIDEFEDACTLLAKYMPNPIPHEEMMELCRMMDIDGDGVVTLNEFLETFRLVSQKFNK